MAELSPELRRFYEELIQSGEVTEDERVLLEDLLGRPAIKRRLEPVIEAGAELERLRRQYDQKLRELETLHQELSTTPPEAERRIAALEAAIREREEMLERVAREASQYAEGEEFLRQTGLDRYLHKTSLPPAPQEPAAPSGRNSAQNPLAELLPVAQVLVRLPFDLAKFQKEYRELTGRELDPEEFYRKVVEDGTGNYHEVYLREYNIEELRRKRQEERLKEEIERRVQEELSRRLMPNGRQVKPDSDFERAISQAAAEAERRKAPPQIDHGSVVAEAVQEFVRQRNANK